MNRRYILLAEIRAGYFDVVALQRRIDLLEQLVKLSDQSTDQTAKLLNANQVSRLDLVQLEVERERLRADLEAAHRELPGAQRKLAARRSESTTGRRRRHSECADAGLQTRSHATTCAGDAPEIRSAQINMKRPG